MSNTTIPETYTCLTCGTDFPRKGVRGRIPKYCSKGCRPSKKEPKPSRVGTCVNCGAEFAVPAKAGALPSYCSGACEYQVKYIEAGSPTRRDPVSCQRCGIVFVPYNERGPAPEHCSEYCRYRSTRGPGTSRYERDRTRSIARSAAKAASRPRTPCRVCSSPVEPPRRTLCSDECYRRASAESSIEVQRAYKEEHGHWPRANHTENKAKRSARDARRRIRLAQATVEVFDPAEVFARDGWVCQLCNEPVDKNLEFPDPRSKSLDHIVPVSKGGEHSRKNTQLAHFGCNSRKQDRVDVSQPELAA